MPRSFSYYQSRAFTGGLAKSTQGDRRAILESFRKDHGSKRVGMMHAQALQAIVNGKTPTAQRNFVKAMRGFLDHCLSLNMITVDPLSTVKLTKTKKSSGFHPWSEDEISQFKKRHAAGSKARLALELLLQTGHARSDVVRMGAQHVKGGKLSMRRKKTNVPFDIPVLPDLVAELALHSRADSSVEQLAYLVTEQGDRSQRPDSETGSPIAASRLVWQDVLTVSERRQQSVMHSTAPPLSS